MSDHKLTQDQLLDARRQMRSHCRLVMENYEAGTGEYEMLSARGVLNTLGFHGDEVEQVLQYLFDGGFTYCLDPDYHRGSVDRPSMSVCHFGADQLESRL